MSRFVRVEEPQPHSKDHKRCGSISGFEPAAHRAYRSEDLYEDRAAADRGILLKLRNEPK
jgi:hypothetical protein